VAARNNLAQLLLDLRRYPEALAHLEELRRRGMSFPGTYMSLAEAYVATDQPAKAREALTVYVKDHPDRSAGYENLGSFELVQGRVEEALAAFDRAASLHPDQLMRIEEGRFAAHALRDRWPEAQAAGQRLLQREDPRDRWAGGEVVAIASLYRGDVAAARQLAEEGVSRGRTVEERAGARLFRAQLENELGRHAEALQQAERALEEGRGVDKLQAEGQAVRSLCLARLGRRADAERAAAEAEARLSAQRQGQGEAQQLQLRGSLALALGDHAEARRQLERAAALPPSKRIAIDTQRVELQYDLARAALAGGDAEAARRALQRVVDAGLDRVFAPIPYVRSLAMLAALEEKQGRSADARRLYERYLGYWKDGQLDRAEVLRAGRRVAALRSLPSA
jgi:tetratricopeptide (TPR) repeat protein